MLLLSCLSPAAAVRWAGAAILLGQGLSASRVTLPRNVQGGARADIAQGGVGEGRAWRQRGARQCDRSRAEGAGRVEHTPVHTHHCSVSGSMNFPLNPPLLPLLGATQKPATAGPAAATAGPAAASFFMPHLARGVAITLLCWQGRCVQALLRITVQLPCFPGQRSRRN